MVETDRSRASRLASVFLLCLLPAALGASCGSGNNGGPGTTGPTADEVAALVNANVILPPGSFQLTDPPMDTSVTLTPPPAGSSDLPVGVPNPMSTGFSAPSGNVVAAGLRFGTTGPVNVIPIAGAQGNTSGTLNYSFQVPDSVCQQLSGICHSIICYEYAVTSAGTISAANIMQVALACGNCDEPSCQSLLNGCGAGPSPFQGTITGTWSGGCSDPDCAPSVSGSFTMNIASDGSITGSYTGSDAGTLGGTVSASGQAAFSATGSAGGFCSWSGQFQNNGGALSASGSWGCQDCGCSGSWSGNGS
jgi:hypothetical protein